MSARSSLAAFRWLAPAGAAGAVAFSQADPNHDGFVTFKEAGGSFRC